MDESKQRRLAAIVSADVVGYSSLMGADEDGTLAALQAMRKDTFAPAVTGHNGDIVKRMGDGWLVEFGSVVDAVNCALAVQQALPAQGKIKLRIGIHIGDIVHDEEDIYGDGINIAARLQEHAAPGCIHISDVVRQQVSGKIAMEAVNLGPQTFKNIAEPLTVYRLGTPTRTNEKSVDPVSDKPSIAVLPFDNMSGDPEQAFFADGISEDIITDLSKIAGLFVIARNSSFAYRGQAIDISTVAGELGVRYVLEGSVRRGGNRVRVNAQLIDAATGGHLWADRYDGDLTDIFAMQDEVTANIVQALAVTLGEDEERRFGQKGTDNPDAYELMLLGRELFMRTKIDDAKQAKEILEKAIELDPGFGLAYAYLALVHVIYYVNGLSEDPDATLKRAHDLGRRGVDLSPDDAHVHVAYGSTFLWLRRHDEAIAEAERAVELDPNYAHGLFELGWYLQYAGRAAESPGYFERAMRLDPHHADTFLHFMAQAYFQLGRYDECVDLLRRRLARNPRSDASRMLLAACYGHLSRPGEAREARKEVLAISPEFSLEQRRKVLPYKYPEDFERIVEGLQKAGLPE